MNLKFKKRIEKINAQIHIIQDRRVHYNTFQYFIQDGVIFQICFFLIITNCNTMKVKNNSNNEVYSWSTINLKK